MLRIVLVLTAISDVCGYRDGGKLGFWYLVVCNTFNQEESDQITTNQDNLMASDYK